jgi:hypothetical protein
MAALRALGGQAHYTAIVEWIKMKKLRNVSNGYDLSAQIRAALATHSAECRAYKGGPDYFTRIGRGKWMIKVSCRFFCLLTPEINL